MSLTKVKPLVELDDLQLLNGKPLLFDQVCMIYPVTMGDIAEISNATFKEYLYLLTIEPRTIPKVPKDMDAISFLIQNSERSQEFYEKLKQAFRFFTHEPIMIVPEMDAIQVGDEYKYESMLTSTNFPRFQYIIRRMYRVSIEIVHDNPSSKRAQEIIDKINEGNRKVAEIKAKNGQDDGIDLATLVSSLGYKYRDLDKAWNLCYYAFFDQFKRMQYDEEYETNLRSALAGAKIPKNKMKYWIRKIQDDNSGGS